MYIACEPLRRRRIGRFILRSDIAKDDPRDWLPVFANCVILRAEYSLCEQGIEYIATSPMFDELEYPADGGYMPDRHLPKYEWDLSTYEGRVYSARPRRVA